MSEVRSVLMKIQLRQQVRELFISKTFRRALEVKVKLISPLRESEIWKLGGAQSVIKGS